MEEEILVELDDRLHKSIEAFHRETTRLRTGRAHAGLLEGVKVDYYGTTSPLTQVANISVIDARLISVKPWDRNMAGPIEKAILASDVGLTPSNRGDVVLVPVPSPTGERRREMVKVLKRLVEECKVSIRAARRDANEMLELVENMPEDDSLRAKKKIQDKIDAAGKKIDSLSIEKEAEILEV
jgi:ribosome recycling factor